MHPDRRTQAVADLYPGARAAVYLDTASVGLVSTRVADAMRAVVDRHLSEGVASGPYRSVAIDQARGSIARLVGGEAHRVAFTLNTTSGIALVVNGLDWRPGDNVVVPQEEFASNYYAWIGLADRGVRIRRIPFRAGHAPVEEIVAQVDSRTRAVALSAVQYSSGHRYPLDRIASACRAHDALFVVDGMQAVGALRLDATADRVDVLVSGAHKWLLGPHGVGFAHLSDRALTALRPSVVGWASAEEPFAFLHEPHLAHDARRFESGTFNAAGIAGLGASVDLALELDPAWVEQEVLRRAAQVARACEEAGLPAPRASDPARHSGIVIAEPPGQAAQRLHRHLAERRIACSLRGGGIRFSPHYFTSDDDIDQLSAALRDRP